MLFLSQVYTININEKIPKLLKIFNCSTLEIRKLQELIDNYQVMLTNYGKLQGM